MEFYTSWCLCFLLSRCFNSQRDGILRYLNRQNFYPKYRFNSQRDGILRAYIFSIIEISFVSIPNGMEFYRGARFFPLPCQLFQFPTGWNSTALTLRACPQSFVSIPNGMEFYNVPIFRLISSNMFQFPTGWNSTLQATRVDHHSSKFQFPTGWNSTVQAVYNSGIEPSFNSQRDGILLKMVWDWMSILGSFNSQRDGILL